jgi:hypothetical protein
LGVPRAVHHATVLRDGRILFTGGCTLPGCDGFDRGRRSAIFDPATAQFRTGPEMVEARASNTATLLRDGRVLLVGGYPGEGQLPSASAELYDPAGGGFAAVAPMATGRAEHSATLLPDGRVLIAGGTDGVHEALRTTELFDPATETFSAGPRMAAARTAHVAVAVGGSVVVIGGIGASSRALPTTEIFRDGRWVPGPRLRTARVKHGAVTLLDGRVLVVGGSPGREGHVRFASTELLDIGQGRTRPGPPLSQGAYKLDGSLVRLDDGRVVIPDDEVVDVYDPGADRIVALSRPLLPGLSFRTASRIGARQVLIAGGYDASIVPTADARIVRVPGA